MTTLAGVAALLLIPALCGIGAFVLTKREDSPDGH